MQLARLLEGSADVGFVLDEAGVILAWNRAAARALGFAADEAIGRKCHELLQSRGVLGTPLDHEYCRIATPDQPPAAFDMAVVPAAGETRWYSVSTIVAPAPRGQHLVAHLAQDISARQRREEAAAELVEQARRLIALAEDGGQPAPVTPLSSQEQRVLRAFADGQKPAEVARRLRISPQTLRNHLHHINRKLRTHSRLEAVIHAQRRNLI
jgi:PAS domain S-box-containing protein